MHIHKLLFVEKKFVNLKKKKLYYDDIISKNEWFVIIIVWEATVEAFGYGT